MSNARRHTRQREALLQVLGEASRPLSLDEILADARRILPQIGERTVYRNLSEMVSEMRLTRVFYPGQPTRYELPNPDGGHHPHFICRVCNRVHVLPDETPSVLEHIQPHPDFDFEGEEVILYGVCKDCRNQ